MFDRVWELLRNTDTLLDEAWRDSRGMLVQCRQMYELVIPALTEATSDRVLARVAAMDRELNDKQRAIRKKVFEHLALGKGVDIIHGLELTAIVIDLERIGDLTKNIGELTEMFRQPMEFGPYQQRFEQVHEMVTILFELTQEALAHRDADKAREAMDLYPKASRLCEASLREVVGGPPTADDECDVERVHLVLVLLLRYLKRVAAHLKNVCSALVNPFHQIGFRDGLT
jgi:phosphate uptake regulator